MGEERCNSEHVFHPNGKFQCFTGKRNDWRDAIEKLELAVEALFWGDKGDEASEEYSSEEDDANDQDEPEDEVRTQ